MQTSSIFRLDEDLLLEIFSCDAANEHISYNSVNLHKIDFDLLPLNTLRWTSQVCSEWRNIIVNSPTLWANCIDFDGLKQKKALWRDEVMRRTKRAFLSITAKEAVLPGSDMARFIVDLIDKQWSRIRILEMTRVSLDWDNMQLWLAFSKPANELRVFAILPDMTKMPPAFNFDLPNFFRLFKDRAPMLSFLYFPAEFKLSLDFTSPIITSGSLRCLRFYSMSGLIDIDLLTACAHLPRLEALALTIPRLTTSQRPLPSVNMPELKWIDVLCPTLNMYSHFLEYITPAAGCVMRGYSSVAYTTIAEVEAACAVVSRYANCFLPEYKEEPEDVDLTVRRGCFELKYDNWMAGISWDEHSDGRAGKISKIVLPRFMQAISNLNLYMNRIANLTLDIDMAREALWGGTPLLLKTIENMDVLELRVEPECVATIHKLYTGQTPIFPNLKALWLGSTRPVNIVDHIFPFLRDRYTVAPIEALHLMCDYDQLEVLDELEGMKVVWKPHNSSNSSEYICSLDGEAREKSREIGRGVRYDPLGNGYYIYRG